MADRPQTARTGWRGSTSCAPRWPPCGPTADHEGVLRLLEHQATVAMHNAYCEQTIPFPPGGVTAVPERLLGVMLSAQELMQ